MRSEIRVMVSKLTREEKEELREALHYLTDGNCIRCGRVLSVTQHLDFMEKEDGSKTCMLCRG